jgi:hypothetical protein
MMTLFSPASPLAADTELKNKVEAMHAGQAKIALLKNQVKEAEAAIAGACHAIISFFFISQSRSNGGGDRAGKQQSIVAAAVPR